MEWHFYGSFQFVSKSEVADAEIKKKSIPLFLLFQSLTFSRPHVGNKNLKVFFLYVWETWFDAYKDKKFSLLCKHPQLNSQSLENSLESQIRFQSLKNYWSRDTWQQEWHRSALSFRKLLTFSHKSPQKLLRGNEKITTRILNHVVSSQSK